MIRTILENATSFKWQVQGLGMLRTYLSEEARLHIWHSAFVETPPPTRLHSHPWDLKSEVICGRLTNIRYARSDWQGLGTTYTELPIACGCEGRVVAEPMTVKLLERPAEYYGRGDIYTQTKDEIHDTLFLDGTCTVISRTFYEDRDSASVFGLGANAFFLSARPRPATEEEIAIGVAAALALLP